VDKSRGSVEDEDEDDPPPATERASERALQDTGSLTMSEFSTASGPAAGASLRGEPVVTTLRRGDVVGRYVIISQLGQGGMGVVYAAYDPELDRRVALKLLLAGEDGEAPLEARTRLLREAQALAQLSHPAVVAVHDVGTLGRQVWLAMEFVAGVTLTAWLAERRRGWPEVLAMFRSAGEGLAAAHAAGLVHRDFKPDNVMVGGDGRVRVMDFGLARGRGSEAGASMLAMRPAMTTLSVEVTQAGKLIGTPSYMAPEQWLGLPADARTDQFAFCVALWQGLYGERPFHGETLHELVLAVSTGRRREPRAGVRVPGWLRRVVERGLAREPERRFATMTALLSALASGAGRRRRRFALAGALALGIAVGAGVGARQLQQGRRAAACVAEGASVRALWSEATRGRLEAALAAAEAGQAGRQALRSLDEFAAGWAGARTVACRRVLVEGRWDADTSERAQGCLQAARGALAGALANLQDGDPRGALRVTQAAATLPALTPCLDVRALALRPPLPRERAAQAELGRLEGLLERASSLRAAGRALEGFALARSLVPRADALGWGPLAARMRLVAGPLAVDAGAPAEAEALLEEGLVLAMRAGEAGLTAEALIGLTRVVGDALARREDGLRWARMAAAQLEQIGARDGLLGAAQRASVGDVQLRAEALAAAEQAYAEALAIRERELGPEHPEVAATLLRVATVELARGESLAARRTAERCLAIRTATLGAEHPDVGATLEFLGKTYYATGDFAAAQRLLERAIAVRTRAYGADALPLAREYNNLAAILERRGDNIAAQRLYERALAIVEKALPAEHPEVALFSRNLANMYTRRGAHAAGRALFDRALASTERAQGRESLDVAFILHNMGVLLQDQGEATGALRLYERALEIREARLGPDAPLVADTLNNLANVRLQRGDLDETERLQRRVLAIYERTLPPGHSEFGYPLVGLAAVDMARGRPAEAVVWLERALRVSQGEDVAVSLVGAVRFELARALWEEGRDRPRAAALAREAIAVYRAAPGTHTREQAEVEAWLRAHER